MHFQVLNYIFGTMIILDKCISYWILFDDNDYDNKKMSKMLHGTIVHRPTLRIDVDLTFLLETN